MSRITQFFIAVVLLLVLAQSSSFAQNGAQRTAGYGRLQLDDGNDGGVTNYLYLSNTNGSLGIDANGAVTGVFPSNCALVDMSSTTKGLLIPRMTTAQRDAICPGTTPEGLLVYNLTTHTLDVYGGASWGPISGWTLVGNALPIGGGTGVGQNFIGTLNAQDFVLATNVGVAGSGNGERIRINANGNVTVNTPVAGTALTVNGDEQVNGMLTSTGNSNIGTTAGTNNTFGNGGAGTSNTIGSGAFINSFGDLANQNNFGTNATLNVIGNNALFNQLGAAGGSTNTIGVPGSGVNNINGPTNINTGAADMTTIGQNAASTSTTVINVGTAGGNLTLNNIANDNTTTSILTTTGVGSPASGNVRYHSLATLLTGSNGVEVTLTGGTLDAHFAPNNNSVIFANNRFINTGASTLTITSGTPGTTTLMTAGGTTVGINNVTAGTTNIGIASAGTNTILGATNINNSGTSVTTIGNTGTGGAVNIRTSGANALTLDVGNLANNLTLNNIQNGLLATDINFLVMTAPNSGNARWRTLSSFITGSNGVEVTYVGGVADAHFAPNNASVIFANDRWINTDGMTLHIANGADYASFNSTASGINQGVGNAGTTSIGNTTAGGVVTINSSVSTSHTAPTNTISATGGNNVIGASAQNQITGGTGNTMNATTGSNTLTAVAVGGSNILNANNGASSNQINATGAGGTNAIAANANNTVTSAAGNNIITATVGDNTMTAPGAAGDNTINAGATNAITAGTTNTMTAGTTNTLNANNAGQSNTLNANGVGGTNNLSANGNNNVTSATGNNVLTATAGDNTMTAPSAAGDNTINAGATNTITAGTTNTMGAGTTNTLNAGTNNVLNANNAAGQNNINATGAGGQNNIQGTTNINIAGNFATTIGHLANTQPVAIRSNAAGSSITLDVATTGGAQNLTLNNITTGSNADVSFLSLTGANSGNVRTRAINSIITGSDGVWVTYTGSSANAQLANANNLVLFTSDRFINTDGFTLHITSGTPGTNDLITAGGTTVNINNSVAGTTNIGSLAGANNNFGVGAASNIMGTAGTSGNQIMGATNTIQSGNNTITGTTNINTTGNQNTNINTFAGGGNTTIGGATHTGTISLTSNNASAITLDVVNSATNNLIMNNILQDNTQINILALTGANSGNVRTVNLSLLADEGIQFQNNAFRLGHAVSGSNPIVSNRFVTINAPGSLTFQNSGGNMINISNGGANTLTLGNAGGTNIMNGFANNINGATNINTAAYALTRIGNGSVNHQLEINGNANAAAGDPIASPNWDLAVTGDIAATGIIKSGASITINGTSVTRQITSDAAMDINSIAGGISITPGSGTTTTNGNLVVTPGNFTVTNGNAVITTGNLGVTAGDITVNAGNITAQQNITSNVGTIRANGGGHIVASTGTIGAGIGAGLPTSTLQTAGSFSAAIRSTGVNSALTIADYTIIATANGLTINLPAAAGIAGRIYVVKNANGVINTSVASGGGLIDGAVGPQVIAAGNGVMQFQSDGTNWYIISSN